MANTIPQMFLERAGSYADLPAQFSKGKDGNFASISFSQLLAAVKAFAAGLLELGVGREAHIGLISDNRREWLVSDLAILGLGAADVPRGCDATEQELAYILGFSECRISIVENQRQLLKVLARKAQLPLLEILITYDSPNEECLAKAQAAGLEVLGFEAVCEKGKVRLGGNPFEFEAFVAAGKAGDLATIIYTSGTTGEPKGVMLSQGNFLNQATELAKVLHIKPGHTFLTVLPIWHAFERSCQYIVLYCVAATAYSKPVGSIMLADMQVIRPQWLTSVPRIWESVKDGIYRTLKNQSPVKKALFAFFVGIGETYSYLRDTFLGRLPRFNSGSRLWEVVWSALPLLLIAPVRALAGIVVFRTVKNKLGGRFIAGISGGGALPPAVDRFFDAIGILILEGYGLTETSPVVSVRLQDKPVTGTVGPAIFGTEIKIVDELGERLPAGEKGEILVRGPSVMLGYYRKPQLSAKIIDENLWLDTGDLGMLTIDGQLKITGRAKDTIVLRGGENVEPVPIEQKLVESPYIQAAVVVGQDQRYLAALIVPKQEIISAWAEENGIPIVDYEGLLQAPEVFELIGTEIADLVSAKTGFKSFERVFKFALLARPFEVGKELSAKQEVKRFAMTEIYKKEMRKLFED